MCVIGTFLDTFSRWYTVATFTQCAKTTYTIITTLHKIDDSLQNLQQYTKSGGAASPENTIMELLIPRKTAVPCAPLHLLPVVCSICSCRVL